MDNAEKCVKVFKRIPGGQFTELANMKNFRFRTINPFSYILVNLRIENGTKSSNSSHFSFYKNAFTYFALKYDLKNDSFCTSIPLENSTDTGSVSNRSQMCLPFKLSFTRVQRYSLKYRIES